MEVRPQDAQAFARLTFVEREVDLEIRDARWRPAAEGAPLSPGQAVRTGRDGMARIELPWMTLTLAPATTVRFPDVFVLSAALEDGRVIVDAGDRDVLKLLTTEAEVRGRGRAVVRRDRRRTLVTCLAGRFQVAAARGTVTLSRGEGTLVGDDRLPEAPARAPVPPSRGLWPAKDPVYVAPGESLDLRWTGDAASYQIELLPIGSEIVLLQRDVAAPPVRIQVPWEGAFRWRVSARDARGIEGLPSAEGLIAVDGR